MDLKLDYETFKQLLGALGVYYKSAEEGRSVKLWAFPAWGDVNACTISSPEDLADFEANIKTTATAVESADEAAATDNNETGGRRAVKQQPFTKTGRNFIVSGRRFEIELGENVDCDTQFEEERELQGARLCVKNPTDGDFVDFHVVHPQAGVILTWAETIYIKPDGGIRDEYITGDSKTIPVGLILRMVYHSAGASGEKPVVYIDFLGWR